MENAERLVVSNGSKRLVKNIGTTQAPDWVANKVEAAGSLKPGVYKLDSAKQAVPDGKTVYTGTVVHADAKNVYQERGTNNIVRHARKDFKEVPEVGKYARIGYQNGRAAEVAPERSPTLSKGVTR